MSDRDFHFTLECSSVGFDALEGMISELAANVLRHAGVDDASTIAALAGQIRDAVEKAARHPGRCDIGFTARAGELQVTVSHGGDEWRITQPIPS